MGKAITIPRGYLVNNSQNIGTMNLISGYDYEGFDAKISEVRNKIGESTYDLSLLNKSNNINKWAAFKPTSNSRDDGMHLTGTLPKDFAYQTRSAPYRLGDWIGYNHSPSIPGFQDWQAEPPLELVFGTNEFLWETADTEHTITVVMRLPEFDIRGFNDGTNEINSHWVRKYLDGVLDDNVRTLIDDTMISDRTIYAEYSFTPTNSTLWTGDIGDTDHYREFYAEFYLGDEKGNNNPPIYYANYPSDSGGLMSVTGKIYWRYYYELVNISWDKCQGGGSYISGSGVKQVKVDRKGVEANVNVKYWEDSARTTPFSGVYRVSEGQGTQPWYNYTDGVRGSETTC